MWTLKHQPWLWSRGAGWVRGHEARRATAPGPCPLFHLHAPDLATLLAPGQVLLCVCGCPWHIPSVSVVQTQRVPTLAGTGLYQPIRAVVICTLQGRKLRPGRLWGLLGVALTLAPAWGLLLCPGEAQVRPGSSTSSPPHCLIGSPESTVHLGSWGVQAPLAAFPGNPGWPHHSCSH